MSLHVYIVFQVMTLLLDNGINSSPLLQLTRFIVLFSLNPNFGPLPACSALAAAIGSLFILWNYYSSVFHLSNIVCFCQRQTIYRHICNVPCNIRGALVSIYNIVFIY